jgi:predicted transcriptional regulator
MSPASRSKASQDSSPKLLTETELEMMSVLWAKGEGSVHDVLDALPRGRELAYTSVSTILRILEQKGFVSTRKEGRGHVYVPRVKKNDYETRSVRHLVDRVFGGEKIAVVRSLLGSEKLSDEELDQIALLLQERKS